MRVLHVAEAFGGGLLEIVRAVAEGTAAAGHEAAIAYGRRPETPANVRAEVDPRVELFVLPWARRGPLEQLAAGRALRAAVREFQPDVVHLHSSFSGVVGAMALDRAARVVFTPHSYASALPDSSPAVRFAYRLAERLASRRATLVGAVSHSEARLAAELGAREVVVIENGIEELDSHRLLSDDARRSTRVVAVGRTVPQRRPVACARILSAVADIADVGWLGGGGGDRGEDGRRALQQAGVPLTGWLPRDAVLDGLRHALVYLHWTAWDGQSLSILEAMACDAVVVASDIEPNRELLDERQLCAGEDEAVALIRGLVGDPSRARELLDAQRRRRARYSQSRMVERWLETYDRMCRA